MTLSSLIPRSVVFILALSICSANSVITGKVIDVETNEPIVGANVFIIDTDVGTVSDDQGNFSLDWPGGFPVRIRISHIGYNEQEIIIFRSGEVWTALEPEVLKGEEVIVTGERKQTEREVSSSGELVSLKDVEVRGIRDIGEVLQEMSGVVISTSEAGRQTTSIRGSNANEVSVYLDGVRLNRVLDGIADLSAIDMAELANVEVIRGGNSVLFGPGNFGGVIHLTSQLPLRNLISIQRSVGVTDERDQDLSGNVYLRHRWFGLGGRFSGKSRLYDGRTLFTNLFQNVASTFDWSSGLITARDVSLNNLMRFPGGGVIAKDKLAVSRVGFRGSILRSSGWEAHYGIRKWQWGDSFFDNIERNLSEETMLSRVSKSFTWNQWDGTLQWETEDQSYSGDNLIIRRDSTRHWRDQASLGSIDRGWAGVIRYSAPTDSPDMELVGWELGFRQSLLNYSHNQNISEFDDSLLVEITRYRIKSKASLTTFRIGAFVKGGFPLFSYNLFFNQGWNKRMPTLNDRFLWFTAHNQAKVIMHELSEEEQALLLLGVFTNRLDIEHVSSTEVGANVIWDHNTVAPIHQLEISASIFRNHYIDKIAHRVIGGFLPIPYNTPIASMNGIEIGTRIRLLGVLKGFVEFDGNLTVVYPSNKEVFPNKPSPVAHFTLDWWKGIFHLNISHIYEGSQLYQRAGADIRQYDRRKSTNITVLLTKTIWKFETSVSYTVRNLFSDQVTFVDFAHYSADPFNYYEAHRALLSFKLMLSEGTEKP